MANIATELITIRTGIYGKDIRAAIGDGIEKINNDAEDILTQLGIIEDAVTASETAQAAAEAAKTAAETAATHAMSGTPEGYADLVDTVSQLTDDIANIPTWEISRDSEDNDYIVLQDSEGSNQSRVYAPDSPIASIIDIIYPVGSIYMSVNSVDPSTFLTGTTWEQIEDTFLLAAGSTYAAGTTGGEATHKLTQAELPVISGSITSRCYVGIGATSGVFRYTYSGNAVQDFALSSNKNTPWILNFNVGGGVAHNNMPPYLAVYMWKRTA